MRAGPVVSDESPVNRPVRTILFVHPSDELYGSDRCLLSVIRGLPDRYRAIVALPTDVAYRGSLSRELRAAGADVRSCNMMVLRRAYLRPAALARLAWRFVAGCTTLAQLIHRERVALVHSNTVTVPCGPLAAAIMRRPHIWHIHEILTNEPRAVRFALRTTMSIVPGRIIAVSRATARSIAIGYPDSASKLTLIYNGVRLPICRREVNVSSAAKESRLGFVGRLSPRKGIAEALQAVAILHQRGVPLRLRVFGGAAPGQEWREADYRRMAATLGIESIVSFEGFVPDASERFRELDILLVPSQWPDPFPRTVLEGMAAGCAVVAARNGGGSDEMLDDGVTGLYCDRDPESIAAAIRRLIDDVTLRDVIARNAVDTARTLFSEARYVREVIECYDRLIETRLPLSHGRPSAPPGIDDARR